MTADNLVAAVIYLGLATLVLIGLGSALSAALVGAIAWIEARERREDAADAEVFGPRRIYGPLDAEADRDWRDILAAIGVTEPEVRERYEAARLAERMDKIRADIACNQFRRELEDWPGGAA